jgi:hypothetical protein
MDIEKMLRDAQRGDFELASLTSAECLQIVAMLRQTTVPRLTKARHRELAEESARRFERRALAQGSISRA